MTGHQLQHWAHKSHFVLIVLTLSFLALSMNNLSHLEAEEKKKKKYLPLAFIYICTLTQIVSCTSHYSEFRSSCLKLSHRLEWTCLVHQSFIPLLLIAYTEPCYWTGHFWRACSLNVFQITTCFHLVPNSIKVNLQNVLLAWVGLMLNSHVLLYRHDSNAAY